MKADDFLAEGIETLTERGKERDHEDGERSISKARAAWWCLFGDNIVNRGMPTDSEMWEFMSMLKKARKSQGIYKHDDHLDDICYASLSAESASNNQ